jgi:hypothetical protein
MKTTRIVRTPLMVAAFAFLGAAPAGVAYGATPEAWAAHEKEVVSACVAASNLRKARPGGEVMEFDDRVGFSAVFIEGRHPQPHMKNQRARVLCLFDKRTRTPFVADADSMLRSRER